MAKFYHIYLDPKSGVTLDQIKSKMDLALDWFKYDSKNWIVYTISDAKALYARLEPLFRDGGSLFICSLDMTDYWGWMSNDMWQWIIKNLKRNS